MQGFTSDRATPVHRKCSCFFPLVWITRSNRTVSKGRTCPMQQAARTLPLPPLPLGEGGAKLWTMEIHLCWRAAAWKAANPLLLTEASTPEKARSFEPHVRPYGTVTWESATWVSCHGVAASPFPCQPEPGAGSAGRAGIPQRFRHIPPSPSEQLKGEVTTPALPPLSLARTLQILARLMGKAKAWLWVCFLHVYFVSSFLRVVSGQGM